MWLRKGLLIFSWCTTIFCDLTFSWMQGGKAPHSSMPGGAETAKRAKGWGPCIFTNSHSINQKTQYMDSACLSLSSHISQPLSLLSYAVISYTWYVHVLTRVLCSLSSMTLFSRRSFVADSSLPSFFSLVCEVCIQFLSAVGTAQVRSISVRSRQISEGNLSLWGCHGVWILFWKVCRESAIWLQSHQSHTDW